jgi:hypothetical protein
VKHCLRGRSFETADELFLAIDAVLRGIEKWTLHAPFSIGCRDLRNFLKPMVTIMRELKKIAPENQFYATDVEMLVFRCDARDLPRRNSRLPMFVSYLRAIDHGCSIPISPTRHEFLRRVTVTALKGTHTFRKEQVHCFGEQNEIVPHSHSAQREDKG